MRQSVSIRSSLEGGLTKEASEAIVAVDIIRATTTAVTAVAMGRRCYAAADLEDALRLAASMPDALLAGEIGGVVPEGFMLSNSPAELAAHSDRRPLVLLSSSGTRLIDGIRRSPFAYIASFRNYGATIRHLARQGLPVVLVGAATRGDFRAEDRMCCAWIAAGLIEAGYAAADRNTDTLVRQWSAASPLDFMRSPSVSFLRRSHQLSDLDFILAHFDDVDSAFRISGAEIVPAFPPG
ncbi:MAG TPA: 2-phosphosulfolactate phosphatase [Candidatus Binatia bacterium]|nr:2-phosphosulfolactate phosphatase [Candidatus Binatia bacterium]